MRIDTVRRSPLCINSTLTCSPGACERIGEAADSGVAATTPSMRRITSPSTMPASAAPDPDMTADTICPTPPGIVARSSSVGWRMATPKYARLAPSEPPDTYTPRPRNPRASGAIPRPTEITASPSSGSGSKSNAIGVTSVMPVSRIAKSSALSTATRFPCTERPSPSSTSIRRAPVPNSLALVRT